MLRQEDLQPSLRIALRVCLALLGLWLLVTTLTLAWRVRDAQATQQGLLRILANVTTGKPKDQALAGLGARGQLLPSGQDAARGIDVPVPPGGSAELFDSYRLSPSEHRVDFVVVFDRDRRVATVTFGSLPEGYRLGR